MVEILDGPLGTELAARGLSLEGVAWSATAIEEAPAMVREVHADYAHAGATLHTANTFRTQPHVLGVRWRDVLFTAVSCVREAVPPSCRVLGSLAPVEDCYRPERSPGANARPTHRQVAEALAEAGCDVILCETFAHADEARVAVEEAVRTGTPTWLSLTAGPFGELLSPTDLGRIAQDLSSTGVERILVNCVAASRMAPYVDAIAECGLPFGAYANAGASDEGLGWDRSEPTAGESYARLGEAWVDAGATVIGGCCGTGPSHIEALAARFR